MEYPTTVNSNSEFILELTARGSKYVTEQAEQRDIAVIELCKSVLTAIIEEQLIDIVLD
jgi:hypothetical protein